MIVYTVPGKGKGRLERCGSQGEAGSYVAAGMEEATGNVPSYFRISHHSTLNTFKINRILSL